MLKFVLVRSILRTEESFMNISSKLRQFVVFQDCTASTESRLDMPLNMRAMVVTLEVSQESSWLMSFSEAAPLNMSDMSVASETSQLESVSRVASEVVPRNMAEKSVMPSSMPTQVFRPVTFTKSSSPSNRPESEVTSSPMTMPSTLASMRLV